MAVQRQLNVLGQARVDVPHLRLVESAVCGDFDALAGYVMSGKSPLVVTGFKIDPSTIGAQYTSLKVIVANGALLHYGASESGTIYTVPAAQPPEVLTTTNTNVVGSFVTGTNNFVGVDLVRSADNTTTDTVAFLNADTVTESPRPIALGRTLKYRFVVSTRSFSSQPNVCPLAIVALDVNGFVTQVTDARRLMFRLGSGADVPNPANRYAFSQRKDSPYFSTSSATDPFSGGDKDISSLKSWQDAVMTRLWEVGGGEFWYSATAAWDVIMVRTGGTFSNGDYFTWDGTYLQWKGLKFLFANSTGTINEVADNTANVLVGQMNDGDAVYVDLDRTQNHTLAGSNQLSIASGNVVRTPLALVGSGTSNRYVIAWRIGTNIYTRGSAFAVGFPVAPAGVAQNTTGTPPTGNLGGVAISAPVTTTPGAFTAGYPVALGYQEKDAASGVVSFDSSQRALVNGVTRRSAGTLTIGDQANDSSVSIGRIGQNTNIAGTMSVQQLLSLAAGISGTAGAALNIAGNAASVWDTVGGLTIGTRDSSALSFKINGSTQVSVDVNGRISFVTATPTIISNTANAGITLQGAKNPADANAEVIVNSTSTRTAGKLLDIQNLGTSKANFDFNGNLTAANITAANIAASALTLGGTTVSPPGWGSLYATATLSLTSVGTVYSFGSAAGSASGGSGVSVSTGTGKITFTVAGTYLISVTGSVNTNGTCLLSAGFTLNGATSFFSGLSCSVDVTTVNKYFTVSMTWPITVNANDYIQLALSASVNTINAFGGPLMIHATRLQ